MSFVTTLQAGLEKINLILDDSQIQQFNDYCRLILEWNKNINLTAITDPVEIAIKHMVDSLTCYQPRYFPLGARVVDVGTGAGFPGIPLKILRPDLNLTLLDSLQKRLKFLQSVNNELGLQQVELVHNRAEEAGHSRREYYDIALSRAVARLNILCELCLPLVAVGGYFIALKGAQYNEELTEAKNAIEVLGAVVFEVKQVTLPGLNDIRAIIYLKKVSSTPTKYPRRAGMIEKKPL